MQSSSQSSGSHDDSTHMGQQLHTVDLSTMSFVVALNCRVLNVKSRPLALLHMAFTSPLISRLMFAASCTNRPATRCCWRGWIVLTRKSDKMRSVAIRDIPDIWNRFADDEQFNKFWETDTRGDIDHEYHVDRGFRLRQAAKRILLGHSHDTVTSCSAITKLPRQR